MQHSQSLCRTLLGIKTFQPPLFHKPKSAKQPAVDTGKNEDVQAETKNYQSLTLNFSCQVQNGDVIYFLEGVEIFRAIFHSENCTNVFFEKLKSNDSFLTLSHEQRRKIYAAVRQVLAEESVEVSEEQIKEYEGEALRQLALNLLKESIERSTKRVSENLPQAVAMVFEKIVHATFFAGANELRDILKVPEQKYSAKDIKDVLFQADWERIKLLSGVTRGGARNIKHSWTDKERNCLVLNDERLKPIWTEAKRIAIAAQKSKESGRSLRWSEQVKGAYPDLPQDLIELLSAPRSADAKPANIALTHAARLCIPTSYSTRRLREEIKAWKLKEG